MYRMLYINSCGFPKCTCFFREQFWSAKILNGSHDTMFALHWFSVCSGSDWKAALLLFTLRAERFGMDTASASAAVLACCQSSRWPWALELLTSLERSSYPPSSHALAAVLSVVEEIPEVEVRVCQMPTSCLSKMVKLKPGKKVFNVCLFQLKCEEYSRERKTLDNTVGRRVVDQYWWISRLIWWAGGFMSAHWGRSIFDAGACTGGWSGTTTAVASAVAGCVAWCRCLSTSTCDTTTAQRGHLLSWK